MHSCHLFVCPSAGEDNRARIAVVAMELLVAGGVASANRPHNHVIRSISRGNEGRADPALDHTPSVSDRRWIAWVDAKSRKRAAVAAKNNVCSLVSSITGRSLDDHVIANM